MRFIVFGTKPWNVPWAMAKWFCPGQFVCDLNIGIRTGKIVSGLVNA